MIHGWPVNGYGGLEAGLHPKCEDGEEDGCLAMTPRPSHGVLDKHDYSRHCGRGRESDGY